MNSPETPCTACDKTTRRSTEQWWSLRNYFGFSGDFCPDCYDKISHDSYGNPRRPKDYTFMLLKFGVKS